MGDRARAVGRNVGGCCVPFVGELGPHLTQCGLSRGLPPYQVESRSIQPFGHNRHGPKIVPLLGEAGSPSNTMWLGPRPISVPSGILIHPTIWSQYTNVTDRTDNGPITQGEPLYIGRQKQWVKCTVIGNKLRE